MNRVSPRRWERRSLEPWALLEILFHGYLLYTFTSHRVGLYLPGLAGWWLVALAALSAFFALFIRHDRGRVMMALAVVTIVTFFLAQVHFSSTFASMRQHLTWAAYLAILYPQMRRPNFLKRLVVVMGFIGLVLWPTVHFVEARAFLSGTGIDNANDLGAWAGFCALCFWLWGWSRHGNLHRFFLWILAFVLFLLMAQTVSRSSLLAVLVAALMAFRRARLRDILVALGFFIIIFFIASYIPLAISAAERYEERLLLETGRLEIWPEALRRITAHPWLGYGSDHTEFFILGRMLGAHNSILYLWLAAGVVVVIPFLLMWLIAFFTSLRAQGLQPSFEIDPFPLVLYALIEMQTSSHYYASLWSAAALCYCIWMRREAGK